MKKALEKNVDPAISAYMNAVMDEINQTLADTKAVVAANQKEMKAMKKDMASIQKSVDDAVNNIGAIEIKTKKLIDKALGSRDSTDGDYKTEITALVTDYDAEVKRLVQNVDQLQYDMKRYFDKEKYAITKGLITQIMKEEKANG